MTDLPVNIDSSYADDALLPGRKIHQQHHDVLHALHNLLRGRTPGAANGFATLDAAAQLVAAQLPVRRVRVTTGAIAAGATADVVCAFAAFADLSYTAPMPGIEDASGSLRVDAIVARAVGSITARVRNTDGINARTGTLHVLAVHD